jgi:hypothetical protein
MPVVVMVTHRDWLLAFIQFVDQWHPFWGSR